MLVAKTNVMHDGKTYKPGDVLPDSLTDEQAAQLLESEAVEDVVAEASDSKDVEAPKDTTPLKEPATPPKDTAPAQSKGPSR